MNIPSPDPPPKVPPVHQPAAAPEAGQVPVEAVSLPMAPAKLRPFPLVLLYQVTPPHKRPQPLKYTNAVKAQMENTVSLKRGTFLNLKCRV